MKTVVFLNLLILRLTNARCPVSVLGSLDYIIEHAVWRGWHQVIIYTNDLEPGCKHNILHLVKCLGVNGIASAVNVKEKSRFVSFLGIIIFQQSRELDSKNKFISTINQLNEYKMNNAALDWLIVAKSVGDFKTIARVMNATNIRFDQNIIVTFPDFQQERIKRLSSCEGNFNYAEKALDRKHKRIYSKQSSFCQRNFHHTCNKTQHEINYYKTSERFKNITRSKKITYNMDAERVALWRSSILNYNAMRSFQAVKMTNSSVINTTQKLLNRLRKNISLLSILVIQLFKMQLNSTLFIDVLGTWSKNRSMALVKPPYTVERRNFMGEAIIVGRCNSSNVDPIRPDEDASPAPVLLDDVLEYLTLHFNATLQTRYYPKLGYRTYEGVWTGLLGALMDNSVDIVLEPVTASRQADIDFIFPIARTMYNIYIRHQETSAVRDIFLAPFSPQLILCVVCVALVTSLGLMAISKISFHPKSKRVSSMDAVICSLGILCQQGSSWRPLNPASSVLVLVYLFFALVTYNAYAAFITSVLSVRVANVGSLTDVLVSSDIKIGYVKNGADQMFLMSTKDVQLNEFYIRGYSEAENLVSSTEEGLVRAAKQDYAFFSGQRAARTTIRSLSQARGRCALRELPVLSTRAQLAFPLSNDSPYARPLLVSLLRLRSGGVLSRLEAALVPRMPQCEQPSGFASARAADVRTALLVIAVGLATALMLGVAEFSWKNRSKLERKVRETFKDFLK